MERRPTLLRRRSSCSVSGDRALWSASSGMKALITGVNLAYDESETRKFVKLRGLALGFTLGAMALMGVALATIVGYPPIADNLPTVLRWLVEVWNAAQTVRAEGYNVALPFRKFDYPVQYGARWEWEVEAGGTLAETPEDAELPPLVEYRTPFTA